MSEPEFIYCPNCGKFIEGIPDGNSLMVKPHKDPADGKTCDVRRIWHRRRRHDA